MLDSLDQNIIQWVEDIRTTTELCGWNPETALKVVLNIVNKEILNEIKSKKSLDNALDHIMKLKYPPSHFSIYMNDLKNIKQNNYTHLKKYYEEISNKVKEISITKQWKKDVIEEKIYEIFFENLCKRTKHEFIKNGWTEIKEILAKILIIECYYEKETSHNNFTSRGKNFMAPGTIKPQKIWCDYHKTSSHNNSNCFTQKKLKNN